MSQTAPHNPMRDFILGDIKRKEDEMRANFKELGDMIIPTIPEVIFIRDFLPAFCGEIAYTPELMSTWYLIAGSPFNKVNVVDRTGTVVATVPPILNRGVIPDYKINGEPLEAVFMQHEAMTHISPIAANNKLSIELENRYNSEAVTTGNVEISKQWQDLLEKYGKLKTASKPSNNNTSATNNDDDMEYE
jgi:hypothetical protein